MGEFRDRWWGVRNLLISGVWSEPSLHFTLGTGTAFLRLECGKDAKCCHSAVRWGWRGIYAMRVATVTYRVYVDGKSKGPGPNSGTHLNVLALGRGWGARKEHSGEEEDKPLPQTSSVSYCTLLTLAGAQLANLFEAVEVDKPFYCGNWFYLWYMNSI